MNESFVKQFFHDELALGHFVGKGNDPSTAADIQIIGVVSDSDYANLRDAAPRQIYLCAAQHSPGVDEDGKIAERWGSSDVLGIMQQIGQGST